MEKAVLSEFIEKKNIQTPAYILDKDMLKAHVDRICELVKDKGNDRVKLCYAMKANALITGMMAERVEHIEVCSPGELEICKAIGIPGSKIIFSGVNKTRKNIADAMEYGVDIVTLESVKHYNLVKEYIRDNNAKASVLPRLSGGAQFGMSEAELEYIVDDSRQLESIDVTGIHYFTGTQKKKLEKDREELEYVAAVIRRLREKYGFVTKLLEYGAGLPVPYFEGDDHDRVYDGLSELLEYVSELDQEYKVGIELGRYFAFNSMVYLTGIDDIKRYNDTNICIVDGGIHHINYYGQNMAMRVPIIEHYVVAECEGTEAALTGEVDYTDDDWKICGSLCTFADILVRKAKLNRPKPGDILVFHNVGAYSMTESPALFLSRDMPVIYSYCEQEGLKVVRDPIETYRFNMSDRV